MDADKKSRKHLLKGANKDQVDSLCEATLNVVKKNVPVTPAIKQALMKHKKIITKLALKKEPLHKRRKILIQKGGFLPTVLATVLPLLVNSLIQNK